MILRSESASRMNVTESTTARCDPSTPPMKAHGALLHGERTERIRNRAPQLPALGRGGMRGLTPNDPVHLGGGRAGVGHHLAVERITDQRLLERRAHRRDSPRVAERLTPRLAGEQGLAHQGLECPHLGRVHVRPPLVGPRHPLDALDQIGGSDGAGAGHRESVL